MLEKTKRKERRSDRSAEKDGQRPPFTLKQEKRESDKRARARDKGKDLSGSGHPALPLSLRHPFLTPSSRAAPSRPLVLSFSFVLFFVPPARRLLPLLLYSTTPRRGVLVLRDLAPRVGETCARKLHHLIVCPSPVSRAKSSPIVDRVRYLVSWFPFKSVVTVGM